MKSKVFQIIRLIGDRDFMRSALRFMLAASWAMILCQYAQPVLAANPLEGGPAAGLQQLVKLGVAAIIIVTGLGMCFFIALASGGSMIAKAAGSPYAESQAIMKIIGIVICFLLTAFAIPVSNAVVTAIMDNAPTEDPIIPSVGGAEE